MILVTGGAGFIGSHTCVELLEAGHEVIVFDTTADEKSSVELIKWIKDKLQSKINAVVPTHFHNDCLAGLKAFADNNIPSYGYNKTIALAKVNQAVVPKNSFTDSLVLKVGDQTTVTKFLGEGHTKDNVVAYFSSDNIMFGGCLIKELNATKGFLGDANVAAWPATVKNVIKAYPSVRIVVPGHGTYGDKDLLDYTIKLFETNNN